jgi:hypothetical protein
MLVTITLELPSQHIASVRTRLNQPNGGLAMREHMSVMNGVLGGVDSYKAYMRSSISSAHSSGNYACVYANAVLDTDTVTIQGTALSYVTTPTTTAHFKGVAGGRGSSSYAAASDSGVANGLAICINANATLNRFVRAYASAGTCYVVCLFPSTLGDAITLAETGNGFTRSAATLSGGASDVPYTYEMGYSPTT